MSPVSATQGTRDSVHHPERRRGSHGRFSCPLPWLSPRPDTQIWSRSLSRPLPHRCTEREPLPSHLRLPLPHSPIPKAWGPRVFWVHRASMAQTSRLQVPEMCTAPRASSMPAQNNSALAQGRRAPGQRVLPGMGRGQPRHGGTCSASEPWPPRHGPQWCLSALLPDAGMEQKISHELP